ncbi:polysaccharide pyruvyl transferase family protein [uncultured Amnibacterium sp.]|uniref:polysaccharide pyruvyl transferase family protein n=1 Tax=uncultured Amnibacterium sp. TaxID=1631851 RepID=UPI0035C96C52
MSRILLRAHKDPFEVASPARVFRRNMIGDNVGNLLFSSASYKLLQTEGTEVAVGTLKGGKAEADRINGEVDHVVIPLANAFRHSYVETLDRMSETIENLTVPVTVLGVGAQLKLDGRVDRLDSVKDHVVRFVRAVLDKSPSIGVRGEFTHTYLQGLGFREVDLIGCPSIFLHGPGLRIEKRVPALTRSSRISMNLSPYVPGLGPIVERHTERYPNLRYAAQHRDALGMLLDKEHKAATHRTDQSVLPTHHGHPLVRDHRTSFFVDPEPWMRYLGGFDYSFGTRIHGNIAALLAGTPATVLAHDSRTLELVRYYDIPHRTMKQVGPTTDAAELYAEADFTAFNARHAERFDVFASFLGEHGLRHVYQPGEAPERFDERMAAIEWPGDVGARPVPPSLTSRLRGAIVPVLRRGRSRIAAAA